MEKGTVSSAARGRSSSKVVSTSLKFFQEYVPSTGISSLSQRTLEKNNESTPGNPKEPAPSDARARAYTHAFEVSPAFLKSQRQDCQDDSNVLQISKWLFKVDCNGTHVRYVAVERKLG